MHRRTFVKATTLAAIGTALAAHGAKSKGSALIVGAGIAGLAAASALRAKGWAVTVLEARERIGGRIHTDRSLDGLAIDTGAQSILGAERNPLAKLIGQTGAKTATVELDRVQLFNVRGEDIGDAMEQAMGEKWEEIRNELEIERERVDEEVPLSELLAEALDGAGLSKAEEQAMHYHIATAIENACAAPATEISARAWTLREATDTEDFLLPDGCDQLPAFFARGLDVRLGHIVKSIRRDARSVTIVTDRGEFTADTAIVTLPLGVLKAGTVEFEPALPGDMVKAIGRLAMGALHRTWLRFPESFWSDAPHFIGYLGAKRGEWADWANLEPMLGAPVLCATHSGPYARKLEAMPGDVIVKLACEPLRKMFGDTFTEPASSLVTHWSSDPFSLGAWSHIPPGATRDDLATLAEPIASRLAFAGEHTSKKHPGTLHGAYLSGLRAAGRMKDEG